MRRFESLQGPCAPISGNPTPPHATAEKSSLLVALHHTDLAGAAVIAEKLAKSSSSNVPVEISPGRFARIAVSIGVAASAQHGTDRLALMKRADQALYRARRRRSGTPIALAGDEEPAAVMQLPVVVSPTGLCGQAAPSRLATLTVPGEMSRFRRSNFDRPRRPRVSSARSHGRTGRHSFRRSSVVERAAVNRLVVGSSPTAGANSLTARGVRLVRARGGDHTIDRLRVLLLA